jgi:hypothetical protein
MKKIFYHPFFIRLFHWEYWPFHVVYGPIYFYWLWLCLKARSFFFFNAANPSIKNGGFLMESKKEIYDLLPDGIYPRTVFFKAGSLIKEITESIRQSGLQYPLIGKPDIGMKALMVKRLNNENELAEYADASKVDFLIQECVSYQNEIGIFYYRYPDEANGHISGIVKKEFLAVTGDGVSTIAELIKKSKRAILQLSVLKETYGEKLSTILKTGEEFMLVPYGSHFRGSEFTDITHLADDGLTKTINEVCKKVNGFYFGRLDIRYNTWEVLKQGKNFSIIELNGAGSEPTHMYDPRHSLFFAWKEIIRHWKILYRISMLNHLKQHRPFMSAANGWEMFRQHSEHKKLITGQ